MAGNVRQARKSRAPVLELQHQLDQALKTVRGDNLTKLQEDLNLYAKIRQLFDSITDTLRDMNALTPEQHEGAGFEDLIRRILAQTQNRSLTRAAQSVIRP